MEFLTHYKRATGPGMIKLQASSSNGVHISQIQFAGQTVVSNIWMDEDKDPKYQYCPCDRYDRQCTESQVVLYKKLRGGIFNTVERQNQLVTLICVT